MDRLTLQNPVFVTYAVAATIMIFKAITMSWLTVVRMMQEKGGFRSPDDIRMTPLHPPRNPKQLELNERVERIGKIPTRALSFRWGLLSIKEASN
jgi:glutathione S-transferase